MEYSGQVCGQPRAQDLESTGQGLVVVLALPSCFRGLGWVEGMETEPHAQQQRRSSVLVSALRMLGEVAAFAEVCLETTAGNWPAVEVAEAPG